MNKYDWNDKHYDGFTDILNPGIFFFIHVKYSLGCLFVVFNIIFTVMVVQIFKNILYMQNV